MIMGSSEVVNRCVVIGAFRVVGRPRITYMLMVGTSWVEVFRGL